MLGSILPADIIVTATGLNLKPLGGIKFTVDNQPINPSETVLYKGIPSLFTIMLLGVMLSGLPNLSWTIGYTNASFTLKSDLTSQYVCRLIDFMDFHNYRTCIPTLPPNYSGKRKPILNALTSGYITRAHDLWPKQGDSFPWVSGSNYLKDYWVLKFGFIADNALRFE